MFNLKFFIFLMVAILVSSITNIFASDYTAFAKEQIKKHPYISIAIGLGLGYATYQLYTRPVKAPNFYKQQEHTKSLGKLPIVYSPNYDVTFFGLEMLHPFDTRKYSKIYHYLVDTVGIDKNCFYEPTAKISDEELLKVHTPYYLNTVLKDENAAARIAEMDILSNLPMWLINRQVLNPMRWATAGTVLGTQLALDRGYAFNLSGGYHHAKGIGRNLELEKHGFTDEGDGFCFFADISLSALEVWKKNPNAKILIVDLDAHQGNGHEGYFKDDKRVAIFDMYNDMIYPTDIETRKYITYNVGVPSGIQDAEYLAKLKNSLGKAIMEFKPDFILYNAGTDPLQNDFLGRMDVSPQGIIERDQYVFEQAKLSKAPILMVLSGGYTLQSAGTISKSIENILKNVLKVIL